MGASRARAQLTSISNTPAGGKPGSCPASARAISEQSGWWPTTTTVPPAPSIAASTSSALAPGASRSSTRSSAPAPVAIAAAVSRARSSGLVRTSSGSTGAEPLAQLPRLFAAARAQRPQRVRIARVRVCVADEEEAHADRFTDMRSFRYVFADVFTDRPLAGNQLAVFTDARDLDEVTMQELALELGLSETVFVLPPREGGTVRIRIFTPRNELPFAGHPCLGTAFVLGAPLQLGVIALETGQGIVPVELERDESGRIVFGRMTQPVPTRRCLRAGGRAARGPRRRRPRASRSRSTTTASGMRTWRCRRRRTSPR